MSDGAFFTIHATFSASSLAWLHRYHDRVMGGNFTCLQAVPGLCQARAVQHWA